MPEKSFNILGEHMRERLKRRAQFLLKVDRRIKWLGAGMFCFALFSVLSYFPEFTEKYYSRGLFIVVRYIYDYTLGLLPFSPAIWINLIFFSWFLYKIFKYLKFNLINREVSLYNRLKYSLLSAGSFAGKISVIFFVGWGFNFYRVPIEDRTNLDLHSLDTQETIVEANKARKKCITTRAQIKNLSDTERFTADLLPDNLEDEMRENLEHAMRMMGYPTPGRIRCRTINNDYWLRKFGYTGIYVSFYGEALMSDKIAPVYRPFFYAHEIAHGFGFFDEADANFFAYMACMQSDDPAIRYSGCLAHMIYLSHELEGIRLTYPPAVLKDLRSSGVLGGQEEYSRMILLVHAWGQKYPFKLDKPIEYLPKKNVRK